MLSLILRLGARNLLRNRRRTLITALSVAFGICVEVVFLGMRQDAHDRMIQAGATAGFGVLSLSRPGFITEPTAASQFDWSGPLREQLASVPGTSETAARITATAVVETSRNSTGAGLIGIDPRTETPAINQMLAHMVSGSVLGADDGKGCLIGAAMADHLRIKIGQKLTFTSTDRSGQIVSWIAYLRGTYRTGSLEIDGHSALLPLALMRQVLDYPPDGVSFVAFFAPVGFNLRQLARAIEARTKNLAVPLQVATWRESLPDLAQAIDFDASLHRLLFLFTGVIVSIGVLNTMRLNIIERRREFGVMLALGLTPPALVAMVLNEATLIGVLGLGLGAIVAAPLYVYLQRFGFDLTIFLGADSVAPKSVEDILGCRLTVLQMAMIGGALVLLNVLAAVYPALKAARTVPIEAIRTP